MNRPEIEELVLALERCFISPNVSDSNGEPGNLVDTTDRAARNLYTLAKAITPQDAIEYVGRDGARVRSLTEAMIYIGNGLYDIADAIRESATHD